MLPTPPDLHFQSPHKGERTKVTKLSSDLRTLATAHAHLHTHRILRVSKALQHLEPDVMASPTMEAVGRWSRRMTGLRGQADESNP